MSELTYKSYEICRPYDARESAVNAARRVSIDDERNDESEVIRKRPKAPLSIAENAALAAIDAALGTDASEVAKATQEPPQGEESADADSINHPPHYGGASNIYEAIKVIEAWSLNFNLGNCVKYIARAGKKGDRIEDLQKALWYLNREIENSIKENENG